MRFAKLFYVALCALALMVVLRDAHALSNDQTRQAPQESYYLSICAFFQDEAPYLKEWIEYHRLLGVEYFYLYNNNSQDNYLEILEPYIEEGIVELTHWPTAEGINWMPDQAKAYNHCIKKCATITTWLAIIDIDEFIFPMQHADLTSYLSQYDRKMVGGIKINWQLFGTSYLPTLPKDQLMIESLTQKAPWNYESSDMPDNTVIKCIVKPNAINKYRIHEGDYKNGFYAIPTGNCSFRQNIQIDQIRINHYWTRAEDFFYDVKIGRRLRFMPSNYVDVMNQKLIDLNQVSDTGILKFAPQLRKRMESTHKRE